MKKLCILSALLFASSISAKELSCTISQNLEPVSQMSVSTVAGQKTAIDQAEGISAYITEKDAETFLIEAYLLDYDVRGYSEGHLRKASDKLTFSLWGRTSVVDIVCKQD